MSKIARITRDFATGAGRFLPGHSSRRVPVPSVKQIEASLSQQLPGGARFVEAGQWYISKAQLAVCAKKPIPDGSAVLASTDNGANFLQVVMPTSQFWSVAKPLKIFKSHPIPEEQKHLKFLLWSDDKSVSGRASDLIKSVFASLKMSDNLVDMGIIEDLARIGVNKNGPFIA